MGDKGREAERETWDNSIGKSGKRDAWRLSTKPSTVVRPNLGAALVASVIDVFFFFGSIHSTISLHRAISRKTEMHCEML